MAEGALHGRRSTHSRAGVLAEVALCFALLECALWTRRPAQTWWGVAMLTLVAIFTLVGRRSARRLGLTVRGLKSALLVLPLAALACCALLLLGWSCGWLHPLFISSRLRGAGYILWALVQQFMAQSFYFVRFEELMPSRRAVWVSALLFSLAHIPNPVLLPATFLGGLGFSEAFRRWRNLYPIWVAHAALGM
ncbi:MAG TPA: CPBP family intramembrane glutamic endopeptidase, partial [Terriglobales bacterium]|nr:CPBP family intramembrane glutamic endopeptidase [Terriglobales bacterium]